MKDNIKFLAVLTLLLLAMGVAGESDYRMCLEHPQLEMCG